MNSYVLYGKKKSYKIDLKIKQQLCALMAKHNISIERHYPQSRKYL